MKDATGEKKVKKGFFSRMLDKLDKKMQEQAKSKPCCQGNNNSDQKSCCS